MKADADYMGKFNLEDGLDVDLNVLRGEVQDLLNVESILTDWERSFVEWIGTQLESGPLPLTDMQTNHLYEIWDRVCG